MKNERHCEAKHQKMPKQSQRLLRSWPQNCGLSLAMTAFVIIYSKPLLACAICFGDPDSQMTKGVAGAVLLLVGVVGSVLGGILAVGLTWIARARKLASEMSSPKSFVGDSRQKHSGMTK